MRPTVRTRHAQGIMLLARMRSRPACEEHAGLAAWPFARAWPNQSRIRHANRAFRGAARLRHEESAHSPLHSNGKASDYFCRDSRGVQGSPCASRFVGSCLDRLRQLTGLRISLPAARTAKWRRHASVAAFVEGAATRVRMYLVAATQKLERAQKLKRRCEFVPNAQRPLRCLTFV